MHLPKDAEQRLVRLLALKRHEVPPPGFFEHLPARILVNLRAGSEIEETPWWTRAWRNLIHEPMVGLSYAALGVGAVLFGISVLETAMDVREPAPSPTFGMIMPTSADLVVNLPPGLQAGAIYRVVDPNPVLWFQPTNPGDASTPFSRLEGVQALPAAFSVER